MFGKTKAVFFYFLIISNTSFARVHSTLGKYVNPFIGTDGEGHTFPGAVRPWGMVSVNPHTNYTTPIDLMRGGPVAPSGYHFGEEKIKGFGQTHLSGVGCPDLGAPVVRVKNGIRDFGLTGSKYSKEQAWPGYYSVKLNDFETLVEVTATKRVGVHRFTFKKNTPSHIILSASHNLGWIDDDGFVKFISDHELIGWSETGKFCSQNNSRKVYFAAKINKQPSEYGTFEGEGGESTDELTRSGKAGAFWTFEDKDSVELYIGISYTSIENAKANLEFELSNKNFEVVKSEAEKEWEQILGRINVKGGSKKERTLFYTSLYRTLIHPNVVSDVSGDYPLFGMLGIGNNKFNERYGVFSMWDTYRNVHGLLSLIYPEKQQAMLLTLEDMAHEANFIPQWELLGNEVNMMVGDPALPIIAEGVIKGFKFKNLEELYSILYRGATEGSDIGRRPGNLKYQTLGYIPHKTKGVWGAVSTTLEYAYHDWSLAKIAGHLGKEEDKNILLTHANGWKKLFDQETFTLRPIKQDGEWLAPFDPKATKGEHKLKAGGPGYVEGSAYQYSYMVPHGIKELIALHGGEEEFKKHLEAVFNNGDFTLWNEPDMAYPYLFTYLENGLPITQRLVKEILKKHFDNTPKGLPGNEDVGTLSAWYIFSSLGLYPADPVSGEFRLGIPLFNEIEISIGDSANPPLLKIKKNAFQKNQISFEGISIKDGGIKHSDLIKGGELNFGF